MNESNVRCEEFTGDTVIIPLQEHQGRYKDTGERSDFHNSRFQSILRTLLAASCQRRSAEVEIRGRIYITSIYIVDDEPQIGYVETDRNGVPIDTPEGPPEPSGVTKYVDHIRETCGASDALTPDTRVSLSASFIAPLFELVGTEENRVVPWEVLHEHARILILGEPGAGKTSCLRRLALDAISHRAVAADTFPVYIQLRDFPVGDLNVAGICRLTHANRLTESPAESYELLRAGRLLLLIDGLDELPTATERQTVLENLEKLCKDASRLRIALTSRSSTYDGGLDDFAELRLVPFDDAQIVQWILLCHTPQESRQQWYGLIDSLRFDTELRDLVRNPLLLALTMSLYIHYPHERNDRAGLLRKCIEVLVHDWDAARGVTRWRHSSVTPRQITTLLAQLSAILVTKQREEFTVKDVREVTEALTGFRESPTILLAACQTSGLIDETSSERWRFTHRSFADYFAASHLVRRTNDLEDRFQTYFLAHSDRRVWPLSCALASDADDLLRNALRIQGKSERTAAIMVADALGQEVSASLEVIDKCCHLIVSTLENQLRDARPLNTGLIEALDFRQDDRLIVWAAGVGAERGNDDKEGIKFAKQLVTEIHRARLTTVGPRLSSWLRDSNVPVSQQAADALEHDGWCQVASTTRNGQLTFWIVITRALFPGLSEIEKDRVIEAGAKALDDI